MDDHRALALSSEELGDAIFEKRMGGRSARAIARDFGITTREVEEACIQRLPRFDAEANRLAHATLLDRLERLQKPFLEKALKDVDVPTASIVLKCIETEAMLRQLDNPPRNGLLSVEFLNAPRENSTEKIRRVLDRLVANSRTHASDPQDSPSSEEL